MSQVSLCLIHFRNREDLTQRSVCCHSNQLESVQVTVRVAGIACWLERRTRDQKVASSNPCTSGGRIFFFFLQSQLRVLTLIRCPFHPHVIAVARKRPWSFCQKCRWQVTLKHAYTHDPKKSEWADYAAVQAWCGNPVRKRARTQLVREHSVTAVSAS